MELSQISHLLLSTEIEDRFLKALLAYEKLLPLVEDNIASTSFSSKYKVILYELIIHHWKQYKELCNEDILILAIKERIAKKEEQKLCWKVLKRIQKIPTPSYNWMLEKLDDYLKEITIRKAIYESALTMDDGKLRNAIDILIQAIQRHGISSSNPMKDDLRLTANEYRLLDNDDDNLVCPTRIRPLDKLLKGFHRKQLFITMAPPGVGKSWFCVHACRSALMSGCYVLWITLEIDRRLVLQRFLQNISGTARSNFEGKIEIDNWNIINLKDGDSKKPKRDARLKVASVSNADAIAKALKIMRRFNGVMSIAEYPSGAVGIGTIEKDVNLFSVKFNRHPDLIIIDGFMDLNLPADDYRLAITNAARRLRKLAFDCNAGVMITHQANRQGITAKLIGGQHTSESLGPLIVADNLIALQKYKEEEKDGMLKLTVVKSRNFAGQKSIEVLQNLQIGQFCQYARIERRDEEDE